MLSGDSYTYLVTLLGQSDPSPQLKGENEASLYVTNVGNKTCNVSIEGKLLCCYSEQALCTCICYNKQQLKNY